MSFHSYGSRIDDDLELLSETLEEVLRSSGDPADQKYVELKARAERALEEVKIASAMRLTATITVQNRRFIKRMITCMKNPGKGLAQVRRSAWCWDYCWRGGNVTGIAFPP